MGQHVNMLPEKFHFDRSVNCSDAARALRALVFDEICAASFKKERLSRMYHEVNNSGASRDQLARQPILRHVGTATAAGHSCRPQ